MHLCSPSRHLGPTALLLVGLLAACNGNDNGDPPVQPTDPATEFALGAHPVLLLEGETVDLEGTDHEGDAWSGVWQTSEAEADTVDGTPVQRLEDELTLTRQPTQGEETSTAVYLIAEGGDLLQVVYGDGVICFLDEPGDYPPSARIGASGAMESRACTDGTSSTGSWALEDAGGGLADLVVTGLERDGDGNELSESETVLRIEPDGTVRTVDLTIRLIPFDATLTMEGAPR